jgi:hypothetical protein
MADPLQPIPAPQSLPIGVAEAAAGKLIPAVDRVRLFSPGEWEDFIREWVDSLRSAYVDVRRAGGSGDQGRDIVAFVDPPSPSARWDNYQCKHYDHALTPGDIWVELAKLCFYTFRAEYTVPRKYYFVAPRDVGTTLLRFLQNPAALKAGLKANWSKVEDKITSSTVVKLASLEPHIDAFDFSIIKAASVLRVIEEHRATRWHVARFGGGLPPRPRPHAPPLKAAVSEARYIRALLDAYGQHLTCVVASDDAVPTPELREHLARCRVQFYSAESLRNFSRDTLPPGAFDDLQDEIHSGVLDVLRRAYVDGYARVREVLQEVRRLQLTAHPLIVCMHLDDRCGICHQLVNDGRLEWVL